MRLVGVNRLLYLPYLIRIQVGERTPHLDSDARGVFFGLSAIRTRCDMLRAVMKDVTYSLRDCVEVFREMNVNVSDMMACGGGDSSLLNQINVIRQNKVKNDTSEIVGCLKKFS